MSDFYQSNISNPLFKQNYYEIKKNKKLSQLIYKKILDIQVQEKKEREKFDLLHEQILRIKREKNQQIKKKNNNIIFQPKEEKNYSKINKVGNYNYNFRGNISPVYNRPSFIRRDRNERMHNFVNYQYRNGYYNEEYLFSELSQILESQKEKYQRIINEIELIKLKYDELEKKYEEEKRKNKELTRELEKERNEKKIMDKMNKNLYEINKHLIKQEMSPKKKHLNKKIP